MASQPANTLISVFRRVRSYRNDLRHESVEAITKRLRGLVMSVPGCEILTGVLTRDTAVADLSPYMGEARFGANRGFPIVIGAKDFVTFEEAQEGMPNIDFGFQIGRDKFLEPTTAGLGDDQHQDLRDLKTTC